MSRKQANKRRSPKVSREDYISNIRRQTERAKFRMRKGLMIVVLGVIAMSVAIIYSFYGITVRDHKKYTEMAANTHTIKYPVYPSRGTISSADGKNLAISTFTYTVGITPEVFGPRKGSTFSKAEVEEEVARILNLDVYAFRETLVEKKDAKYVSLKRSISAEKNEELSTFLAEAKVSGIRQDANQARFYPQGDLASTIVGFTSQRDKSISGVLGVEAYYDSLLGGKEGYVYAQVDNYWGQTLPGTSQVNVPAEDGLNIKLTIQSDLQRIVQEYTRHMVVAQEARNGGQIIVMDANTGAILAMSGENNFDLNKPMNPPYYIDKEKWNPEANSEQLDYLTGTYWSNRLINYPFEIGSVMKPFVLGMAFDEGVLKPTDTVSDDFVYVEGWNEAISSYDNRSKGEISVPYAIWDSRNPPFVRIAESLGMDTFYDYIERLGFREKTGVDLPNEQVGIMHQNPILIDMAVTSFGEQFTMSGMQLANAYQMLANDGLMLKPYIVSEISNAEGETVERHDIEMVREVISKQSAEDIRDIMVGVGRYGTAQEAYIVGLESSFKTGTSSRAVDGSVHDNIYTHTAVTLLPADKPKYVIISTLHDVKEYFLRANQIMLRKVSEYLVERDGIPLEYKAYDYNKIFGLRYGLDVIEMDATEAQKELFRRGSDIVLDDDTSGKAIVKSQYPLPKYQIGHDATIWISAKEGTLPDERVELPDFTGMTVEEVRKLAKRIGLNVAFEGENRAGGATEQAVINPDEAGGSKPGQHVRKYTQVLVSYNGEGKPGPKMDDSLVYGMNDGSGRIYGE